LNALIALLNPLSQHFNTIGSTGKREDVECVNGLITKYNDRMKKCETMGERSKARMPPPVTQTSVNIPPPQRNPAPVQAPPPSQQAPAYQAPPSVPEPQPIPLPNDVRVAVETFNRIYASYLRITAPDVWTGRTNDIVNEWGRFCQTQVPIISKAANLYLQRDAKQQLTECIEKFNTFSQDLTKKN